MARYTWGVPELGDGLNFVILAMGMFGLGEIISNLGLSTAREVNVRTITGLMPSREDLRRIVKPILRGTALGSVLGVLPGGGAMLAAFGAYSLEKKLSPNQSESATVQSRALPPRNPPMMPAHRHPSSRCSRSESHRMP
jgi:TctA family transporter